MRLVDDEHRTDGGQRLHIALGVAEQVGFHPALVDELAVARERLVGRHHHRQPHVGRVDEALDRLVGVVDDVDLLVVVFPRKKSRCGLQAFECALANGVARHQHDELRQLVLLVQPVDGFDESERLAGAGLHQHVERQGWGECGSHLQRTGANLIALPDAFDVGMQDFLRLVRHIGRVGVYIGWRNETHIGEHIGNAVHGLRLVGQAAVLELGGHGSGFTLPPTRLRLAAIRASGQSACACTPDEGLWASRAAGSGCWPASGQTASFSRSRR